MRVEGLKPCPFCGAPASMWKWNGGTRIDCGRFQATKHIVGIEGRTDDEAMRLWNTRFEVKEE